MMDAVGILYLDGIIFSFLEIQRLGFHLLAVIFPIMALVLGHKVINHHDLVDFKRDCVVAFDIKGIVLIQGHLDKPF